MVILGADRGVNHTTNQPKMTALSRFLPTNSGTRDRRKSD